MPTLKNKVTRKTKRKVSKKLSRVLSATLYSYVQPTNRQYAMTTGKRRFGSFSAYINSLITIDRKKHFSRGWENKVPTAKDTRPVSRAA